MAESNEDKGQDQGGKGKTARKKLEHSGPYATQEIASNAAVKDERLSVFKVSIPGHDPGFVVSDTDRHALLHMAKEVGGKVYEVGELPTKESVKAQLDGLSPEARAELLRELAAQAKEAAQQAPPEAKTRQGDIPGAGPEQQRRDRGPKTSRGVR